MSEPTSPMSHDELSELVAAYALDAVEPDEGRLIEEHLSVCPRCRAELADHREVTALLAHTGAPAPDGVWDRIAASLEEAPPAVPLGDVLSLPRRTEPRRPPRPRATWTLAAAAAVLVAVLGVQVARQDQQLDDLRAQVEAGAVDPAELALRDPDAEFVELSSSDGDLRVRAVIDAEGRGFLLAHNLPKLGRAKTYQLWGVGATEQPISLGVLGSDPTSASFRVVGPFDALAITAEDAPGVVVSEQAPVVVGEVTDRA
jgi:anti-sigma-K factor RskA